MEKVSSQERNTDSEKKEKNENINEAMVEYDTNVIAHTDNERHFEIENSIFLYFTRTINSAFGTIDDMMRRARARSFAMNLHFSYLFFVIAAPYLRFIPFWFLSS